MAFQCETRDFNEGLEIPECVCDFIGDYNVIPVWILGFQCSYWDTSGDFEFHCGSLDSSMDPEISVDPRCVYFSEDSGIQVGQVI